MWRSWRRTPVALVLLAMGAAGLLVGLRARAEDAAGARPGAGTWVYDVRVVRVDPADPSVLESAPSWQPGGAAGSTTAAGWADLLKGLKARGRTTILLDQRLTGIDGVATEFKQQRRRSVVVLQARAGNSDNYVTAYVESGASGQIVSSSGGLDYRVDVSWEEVPADATGPLGNASWKGSHSSLASGETLALSHREQLASGATAVQGIEIYVFVTAWPSPAK